MKAIIINEFGPNPLTISETTTPQPAADQVLIRAHAAGLNPVDLGVRMGGFAEFMGHKPPLALGFDVAGTVTAVGSTVSNFAAGDEVFAMLPLSAPGALAEYVAAKAEHVAHKPAGLDFLQTAAIPLAGLTAWQAIETANVQAGHRVIVHGASGGVGSLAVQIARVKEATVFATASTRNQAYLQALGADRAIDYKTEAFDAIATDLDVVIDLVGDSTQERSWACLKPGGFLATVRGQPDAERAAAHGVEAQFVVVQPSGAGLAALAELVNRGELRVWLDGVYSLSDAESAFARVGSGRVRGKVVVQIRS